MSNSLYAVTVDCADAPAVAQFWGTVLDRKVAEGSTSEHVVLLPDDGSASGPRLVFNNVPEVKTVKNRVHLDVITQQAEAETRRLLGLGATVLRVFEENGRHRWTTFADPEGNEFDLIAG
jgi:predicted enzyme related to lactoylglutathione lyase